MAASEARVICEVLEAVLEKKVFTFVAVGDERTCPECAGFNGQIFTEDEAESMFDYLEKNHTVWKPNVHPNCRCRLVLMFED